MMQNFHVLEDVENQNARNLRRKKSKEILKDHVQNIVQKKALHAVVSNRGALQTLNNGARQEAKRIKLACDEVTCLETRLKEHLELAKISQKISEKQLKVEEEEDLDTLNANLLYVAEYRKDVWNYLLELESSYNYPKSKYMLKQTDLSWNTRAILVDWLASVAEEYKLCTETFHLSVNYIDRFLSQIAVIRTKFQLVGAAAMLLAGKMEEIYPIDVKEWTYLAGDAFTSRQVLKMEQLLARMLKFKMQPPTMATYIEHFCTEHNLDAKTTHLALFLSDLVLLEGEDYLNVLPSKLAASCIALARYTLSKNRPWPKKFREQSGYTVQQLSPVMKKQQKTFKDSPLKEQQAIQSKYKTDQYNRVALLKPRILILEEFADEED